MNNWNVNQEPFDNEANRIGSGHNDFNYELQGVNLEKQEKEFEKELRLRRANTAFSFQNVPLPEGIPTDTPSVKYVIKGITSEYFSVLNGTVALDTGKRDITVSIYYPGGQFRGTSKKVAPTGHVIVVSNVAIGLPFRYKENKEVATYLDFIETEEGGVKTTYYFYSISKKYLYRVNYSMLIMTERARRNHYGGVRLRTTTGHLFYVYVIPYNNNLDLTLKKISVQEGEVSSEIINSLISFWESMEFILPRDIFDGKYFELQEGFAFTPVNEEPVGELDEIIDESSQLPDGFEEV